jgi:hypothetical protein
MRHARALCSMQTEQYCSPASLPLGRTTGWSVAPWKLGASFLVAAALIPGLLTTLFFLARAFGSAALGPSAALYLVIGFL